MHDLLLTLSIGHPSHHVVRMLKQHYTHVVRGRNLWPTATQGAILEVAPLAPVELSDEAAPTSSLTGIQTLSQNHSDPKFLPTETGIMSICFSICYIWRLFVM